MAEPGDPNTPSEPTPEAAPESRAGSNDARVAAHAHDDMIGFTSPSSLIGRPRDSEPEPSAEISEDLFASRPEDAPEVVAPEPAVPMSASEEPIFSLDPVPTGKSVNADAASDAVQTALWDEDTGPVVEPPRAATADALPAWAVETPRPAAARPVTAKPVFGRADSPVAPPEGAMGLYTSYALILFAVLTLGVAALIALVAVIGRPAPQQALALSHHIYQKRTLWIAAITAALGVVLIAVNLGVFVLFLLAVWVIVRGTTGILKLSAGQAITRPNGWLV